MCLIAMKKVEAKQKHPPDACIFQRVIIMLTQSQQKQHQRDIPAFLKWGCIKSIVSIQYWPEEMLIRSEKLDKTFWMAHIIFWWWLWFISKIPKLCNSVKYLAQLPCRYETARTIHHLLLLICLQLTSVALKFT